ncbi:MAG: TrbG/VirB9 family P-type conjugative transfer protein [Asticcacaulis sp.]|uniref:TrbG/VirB9 family P-type conjugative transfer protein n=1 Tax=Asticcacaulis sp. TaxID=1872648 RepID=UPI003F7BBCC8
MIIALYLMTVGAVVAAPAPVQSDPRIRTLDYVADGVITVPVSTGVVTRVVLERGENIIAAATGAPSKCDSAAHLWCIVADADANEVWIKPKAGARRNNLELKTDKRDYSFDLVVGKVTTYRIVLRYPQAPVSAKPQTPSEQETVAARLAQNKPIAKNLNYSLESNRKGADITPKAVFDDGLFTYFKFPGNSEVPTIFVIGSDGKEARANFNMAGDYVVVQQLGRQFVLRLGKSVVSVWNESFDPTGSAPVNGTTAPGVSRETVGAGNDQ